jgi:hypothetical protein
MSNGTKWRQVVLKFDSDELVAIRELPGDNDRDKIMRALALAVRSYRAAQNEKVARAAAAAVEAAQKPSMGARFRKVFGA